MKAVKSRRPIPFLYQLLEKKFDQTGVVGVRKKKFWLMALHVTVLNSMGRGLMGDYHELNTDVSRLSVTFLCSNVHASYISK